jgi:hypothetical protein
MTDWTDLTRRAALASHRLVGWTFWDPAGIRNYAALGVPDGVGYYFATRGATLGDAGNAAVTASFGSIHGDLVAMALDLCRGHTSFEAAAGARDEAVVTGLRRYVPDVCEGLAALADPLWDTAGSLPLAGRVLFASLLERPRPSDRLLSAWLAVNCIREWRGDTHWAIQVAEELDGTMAGILDGAWRNYASDWLPRSRGADDAALEAAMSRLEERGLAADGKVNEAGISYRQGLEDRLDRICERGWRHLGEERTTAFLDLVEPVGDVLVRRIDETAGPNWMPAARDREARP